jgi:hypothetical protein
LFSTEEFLLAGEVHEMTWKAPETGGFPIAEIGIEIRSPQGAPGTIYLDYLTWSGAPTTTFFRSSGGGTAWRYAWVNAADQFLLPGEFRVVQNHGVGMVTQGTQDWRDYSVEATITPHMVISSGVAARVQGLRRYYALLLAPGGKARLVKSWYGQDEVLAEADFAWEFGSAYTLSLAVKGDQLSASIDGKPLFTAQEQ